MKAIVQDTYGSPDVLQLREIDTPQVWGKRTRGHGGGGEREWLSEPGCRTG